MIQSTFDLDEQITYKTFLVFTNLDVDTDIHVPLFWVTQYTKIVRYLCLILDLFSKLGK